MVQGDDFIEKKALRGLSEGVDSCHISDVTEKA